MLIVDLKGEIAAVSLAIQAALGKYAYCINPSGLLGLGNHPVDPLDILGPGPLLVPDCKMIAEMLVPLSSGKDGLYFQEKARLLIDGILVADVEMNGKTGLRSLYKIINAIEGDPNTWLAFAERAYTTSCFDHVRRLIGEMIYKQKEAPKEFGAIVGETTKSLSFLDDPAFLDGLDKPAVSLSVLCERRATIFVNIPAEYIGIWSSYLRLVIGVAMLYKQRRPQAPRVVFLIDEAGQLGPAPFLLRALTFGRGSGVCTQAIYQSFGQLAAQFGRDGAQTALSSCAVRQVFGVRDLETAEMVSRMLGTQTISYDAELEQAAARRNQAHIVRELMAGGDPLEAGLNYAQQKRAAADRKKMGRPLLDASEILRMPEDRQILFVSGINCPPIAAWRVPYFQQRQLAGKYGVNPYHPPLDRVRVRGRFGMRWRRVITEPVPERFADYPQYQSGFWSYIKGYRPS
jgi:type IV secretion system protein VirD4